MDKWSPISESDFSALLAEQFTQFEPLDRELWAKHQVALRRAPILRSPNCGTEQVFVVAAVGDRILFFDDVEDEFGVARLPEQGPLEDYGTFGELRFAPRGLARYAA